MPLHSFKSMCKNFKYLFPVLPIDVDADIRKSYKGGFIFITKVQRKNYRRRINAGC